MNDLLLVAGGDATAPEPLLAGPVIVTAVDSLRILAGERGVQLTVDVTDETTVRIAEVGLRRCVVALVDNALAHSPRGTHVSVTANRVGADLVIRVADHGAGIVGIAPERVFDRFAHAASVRPDAPAPVGDTPARPSFGIGLALVREIVTRHGGRVRVESTSPAGTVMAVELPAG